MKGIDVRLYIRALIDELKLERDKQEHGSVGDKRIFEEISILNTAAMLIGDYRD